MKANVGGADKVIRLIVGIVLLSLVFWVKGPGRWFGLLGILPLLTVVFSFCPVYPPLGISTKRGGDKPAAP